MQTRLADFIRDTPEGAEADAILRKCVHCGFLHRRPVRLTRSSAMISTARAAAFT